MKRKVLAKYRGEMANGTKVFLECIFEDNSDQREFMIGNVTMTRGGKEISADELFKDRLIIEATFGSLSPRYETLCYDANDREDANREVARCIKEFGLKKVSE